MESTNQKQSISDDQELAKVLAGINNDAGGSDQTAAGDDTATLMPTPTAPMPGPSASAPTPAADNSTAQPEAVSAPEPGVEAPAPGLSSVEPMASPIPSPALDSSLEDVKRQALGELRPLVDKLNVDVDEKFDIYLLLLRSTDDKDLIAPAHEAAKAIPDESKRAQALLDVIKEIDFLSQNQGPK